MQLVNGIMAMWGTPSTFTLTVYHWLSRACKWSLWTKWPLPWLIKAVYYYPTMKQINTGKLIGSMKLLFQQITPYLNIFTLVFSAIAAYAVVAKTFLEWGIQFPFWIFLLLLGIGLTMLLAFEYFIMFPSFFSSWNKQWWDHDNPMRKEMKEMREQMNRIEKGLEK